VASGSTITCLAESIPLRARRIFGFDSFEGLPEPWATYEEGHFACTPPTVPANVELVVGMFDATLAPFLATHAGAVALAHIDCDLYRSTRTVLDVLDPRIVAGTIIVMDEYFIVTEHEQRAFLEWMSAHARKCRHLCRSIEQLCVEIEA
jgi:hypothetical protein